MTKASFKGAFVLASAFILLALATLYWRNRSPDSSPRPAESVSSGSNSITAPQEKRISDLWEAPSPAPPESNPKAIPDYRIDEAKVYRALSEVRLDGDGNLIVDHLALQGLYSTLGYGSLELSEEQLTYIQKIIQEKVPGIAGEQTAELVAGFYQYLKAKRQLDALYLNFRSPEELGTRLTALDILRELYLGVETAGTLFAEQEIHEQYMLANMRTSLDNTLSEEDKSARRDELARTHLNMGPDIVNWEQRYAGFLDEKQMVLNSSLSPPEKKRQIDTLYEIHFTETERKKISHLKLAEF